MALETAAFLKIPSRQIENPYIHNFKLYKFKYDSVPTCTTVFPLVWSVLQLGVEVSAGVQKQKANLNGVTANATYR